MSLNISHVVVIGCSLSYGQGLENPKQDSWPAILASKLGVPVVNLSSRGGGNDRIMRRLFEYHYLNSTNNNNPFYVLAFSHSSRREEYIRAAGDYMVVSMKDDPSWMKNDDFSFASVYNYESLVTASKKIMINSYILDFLRINNIKYLITDFMPDSEDDITRIADLYKPAYEKVYTDPFRIESLSKISIKYPRLPCGHDDVEAQLEIGNYVHNELISRYGLINSLPQEFSTLQNYFNHYEHPGSRGDTAWL